MVFFRNVQVRWMPIGAICHPALERPASGDAGVLADRVGLQHVRGRAPAPGLGGEYRMGGSKGYVEVAGIVGRMAWDDVLGDQFDLSGSATRWGINVSSNIKLAKATTVRLQFVHGEGIQNYMNDAPVDVGVAANPGDPRKPITGKALPLNGLSRSSITGAPVVQRAGCSRTDIDQLTDRPQRLQVEMRARQPAHTPAPNVMLGGELQWGRREMFRIRLSARAQDPVWRSLSRQASGKWSWRIT